MVGTLSDITSKLTRAIDANSKMADQEVETTIENAILIALKNSTKPLRKEKYSIVRDETISLSKTTALNLQNKQSIEMQDEFGDDVPTSFRLTLTMRW